MLNPATGRMLPRLVDVTSESYACARMYMIRLEKADFETPEQLARLGKVAGLSADEFARRFGYLLG